MRRGEVGREAKETDATEWTSWRGDEGGERPWGCPGSMEIHQPLVPSPEPARPLVHRVIDEGRKKEADPALLSAGLKLPSVVWSGLPWGSGKESTYLCSRCGFDPWVRKIPRRGNGNPLQYSCLENPMDRGAWRATVHGVTRVRHAL